MATKSGNRTTARHKRPTATKSTPTPSGNGSAPSNRDALRKLYLSLLKSRLVQEAVQRGVRASAYDFAIGHEAIVAGATADLEAQDTITARPRDLAALLAKGLPLKSLLASDNDVERHVCGAPAPASFVSLPEDPFHLGTGIALAHKLENRRRIVMAFGAPQASLPESWHTAMKFAGVHKLPVVYVISSEAASAPGHLPHLEEISFMARDCGFPGVVVDAQDVVAVWRVGQESILRARNGGGPTLIDCRTDPARDPLAHLEHYMRKRNAWDEDWKQQLTAQITAEIAAAAP